MIINYLPAPTGALSVNNGSVSSILFCDSDEIVPVLSDRLYYVAPNFFGEVRLPCINGGGFFYMDGRLQTLSTITYEESGKAIEAILAQCDADLRVADIPSRPQGKAIRTYACCAIRNAVYLGVKIRGDGSDWTGFYQYRDGVVRKLEGDLFVNSVSIALDDGIVLQTFGDERAFLGFDSDFEELWRVPLPAIGNLCSLGDKVALYIEAGKGLDGPADIVVLDPRSGERLWNYSFFCGFRNLWSHDGLLYVACHGSGYVFDAETGERLLILSDICEAQVHREMLFGNGDYVFFVNYSYTLAREATSERTITAFNQKTGEKIREIKIPEGWEYRESGVYPAVVHENGKFYVPIQSDYSLGSAGGILVIDCDDLESEPCFDSDISFDTRIVSVGKQVECEVHVSWSDFDEIMRYAPPAMKAVGISEGRSIWTRGVKNKKFNGRVHLVVDSSAVELGDWERNQLDMAISCVTDHFSGLGFYASDGKTKMTAHWRVL